MIEKLLETLADHAGAAGAGAVIALLAWLYSIVTKSRNKTLLSNDSGSKQITGNFLPQYLTDVIRRNSSLSFGDPASRTVGEIENHAPVTLDQIWTPLRVADSQTRKGKVGTHENMAEENGTDLKSLFESSTEALLILGDPGSGKSTSLAMFAVDAARNRSKDSQKAVPVCVNLGSVLLEHRNEPISLLLTGVPELETVINRRGREAGVALRDHLADHVRRADASTPAGTEEKSEGTGRRIGCRRQNDLGLGG